MMCQPLHHRERFWDRLLAPDGCAAERGQAPRSACGRATPRTCPYFDCKECSAEEECMGTVAIQGYGRIGRTLLRIALRRNLFTPVSTSDIKDLDTLAALLEVDTNHSSILIGPLANRIGVEGISPF